MRNKSKKRSVTLPYSRGVLTVRLQRLRRLPLRSTIEKGDIIYATGDDSINVYVLVNGIVTFLNKSSLVFINNLTPLQRVFEHSMIFGWAALVPEYPHRLGSAQCLEDSKILSINGAKLLNILERDTQSGFLVMKRLCSLIASTFVEKP